MSKTYTTFVGIDIGKLEFVMNFHGDKKTCVYKNSLEGFAAFWDQHQGSLKGALVVLEVTGGHERLAISFLQDKGVSVHRANTRKVKSFIRSYGVLGKSDALDAIALARYGAERNVSLEIYAPPAYELLRELSERRQDLVQMRVQEKNRAQAPSSISLKKSFEVMIKALSEQIADVEKQMADMIEGSPELQLKLKALQSVDGIGVKTAHALLAQLPEIGTLNQKQVASLSGVAPHPNQSGTKDGYRKTRGGRRQVRALLYTGALSVTRSKKGLGLFYHALVERGKPKLCAIIAVMRKMVVIANARVKEMLAAEPQNPSSPLPSLS